MEIHISSCVEKGQGKMKRYCVITAMDLYGGEKNY